VVLTDVAEGAIEVPKAALSRSFVVRKVVRTLSLGETLTIKVWEVEVDVKESELWLEAA
jgi:hypothetical protein